MEFNPKVSIIIPVYNGENYMKEAIDSALNQTYKNIEIIVVNDGSTDQTEKICFLYGDKIRYFKKDNGGQSSALNYGIQQMKSDYFSWLSHDDVYLPVKIQTQIDYLENSADKDIILFSDFESINKNSEVIEQHRYPQSMLANIRYQFLAAKPVIHGCSALIPKSCFDKVGLFELDKPCTSDVRLFYRMSEKYRFVHIPEILIQGRVHFGQMSYKKAKELNDESNDFLIYCFERIKPEESMQASGIFPFKMLIRKLCIEYTKGGYYKAYRFIFKALKSNGASFSERFFLDLKCRGLFVKKYLKLKIKSIIKL